MWGRAVCLLLLRSSCLGPWCVSNSCVTDWIFVAERGALSTLGAHQPRGNLCATDNALQEACGGGPGLCPGLAVWGLLFSRDVSGALCFLPPGQPQEPVLSVPAVTIAAGQGWNKERAVPCSSDVLPSLHVHFSDCMFFYLLTQTSGQYLIVFYQQGLGLGILKKHPRSKVGSLL